MNQNRMVVGLAIALVVAFVLSTFVYKQFQKASAVKPVDNEHVVVASSPMQLGTRVDASNLKLIPWPAGQPVAGMFTSIRCGCESRADYAGGCERDDSGQQAGAEGSGRGTACGDSARNARDVGRGE